MVRRPSSSSSSSNRLLRFGRLFLAHGGEQLLGLCRILSTLSGLVAALALLLLIALAVNGHANSPAMSPLLTTFVVAMWIGATAVLIRNYQSIGLGWLGILLGAFFLYMPFLVALLGLALGFSVHSSVLTRFYHAVPGLGIYLIIVSLTQLLIANVCYSIHGRRRMLEQFTQNLDRAKTRQPSSLIPKCWEMHSCRDAVRARCPNYVDHTNCWHRRTGCLCDRDFTNYLSRNPALDEKLRRDDVNRVDLTHVPDLATYPARLRRERPRSWRIRRAFCHKCAIFLEHQGYKYRRFNWIFLPVTLALAALLYHYYHWGFGALTQGIDRLSHYLATLGYLPDRFVFHADSLTSMPSEYVLLVALGLLLLSYVLEFTDKCLLEWMW